MVTVSSSCTDVIVVRNSLSRKCSGLRHPAEASGISFPLPRSDNLPPKPGNCSPGWLWAIAGCPFAVRICPCVGPSTSTAPR